MQPPVRPASAAGAAGEAEGAAAVNDLHPRDRTRRQASRRREPRILRSERGRRGAGLRRDGGALRQELPRRAAHRRGRVVHQVERRRTMHPNPMLRPPKSRPRMADRLPADLTGKADPPSRDVAVGDGAVAGVGAARRPTAPMQATRPRERTAIGRRRILPRTMRGRSTAKTGSARPDAAGARRPRRPRPTRRPPRSPRRAGRVRRRNLHRCRRDCGPRRSGQTGTRPRAAAGWPFPRSFAPGTRP